MHHPLATGLVGVLLATAAVPVMAQDRIAERDMLRFCQGEASAEFGVNPRSISMGDLSKGKHGGHTAAGTYVSSSGDVGFKCRFDPNGRFKWVRSANKAATGSGGPSGAQVYACNGMLLGKGDVLEASGLKPGAYELIMRFPDGNYVCDVEADGRVTYFEKLR